MKTNAAGLSLIKEFEGFVPNWYPDPAKGWKVPTCCIGHTDAAGEPFYKDTKDKKFTLDEGLSILAKDLRKVESNVSALVSVPLSDNQFAAIVSFVYNVGEGNFKTSTLRKKLNAGDYVGASNEFGKWVNAGGKKLKGLERRREAERQLFMSQATVVQKDDEASVEPPVAEREPIKDPMWLQILKILLKAFLK